MHTTQFNHTGYLSCVQCSYRVDSDEAPDCCECGGKLISSAVKAERLAESAWEAERAFEKFHKIELPEATPNFLRVRQAS